MSRRDATAAVYVGPRRVSGATAFSRLHSRNYLIFNWMTIGRWGAISLCVLQGGSHDRFAEHYDSYACHLVCARRGYGVPLAALTDCVPSDAARGGAPGSGPAPLPDSSWV